MNRFATWVFNFAGIYGVVALAPMYFTESKFSLENPPAIGQPGFYYGFVGVALAFQLVFFIIAQDPGRYRLIMLPSLFEKLSFGGAAVALHLQGRLPQPLLLGAMIDFGLAALFFAAFLKTEKTA